MAIGNNLDAPSSHWSGQKPQDNLVFGFNIGTALDNRKLTLNFDWNISLYNRDIEVQDIISNPMCLNINKTGQPAHPLYQKKEVNPKPYCI